MSEQNGKTDLALGPGTFCFMQDMTKGEVKAYVGPCIVNQTAQERPVKYDPTTDRFEPCPLWKAEVPCVEAREGEYIVLRNPVLLSESDQEHPPEKSAGKICPALQHGRIVNIPGPCKFALWPGQAAQTIPGHQLRSNQYLVIQVYNEEEARKGWAKAIIKPAADADGVTVTPPSIDLVIGKPMIIQGTNVSFYIPPTGVIVVPDGVDDRNQPRYVREALTLERLEYCILVDEDGNKRYERGPQVVFPKPTETWVDRSGRVKFRAIELNPVQGIHIKVISAYKEDGKEYKEGDELFIKGDETAIYYPREEHSSISYDGKAKHFATAIPAGEARYVMERLTGEIKKVEGPEMLLPDPRTQVIVRRVLSGNQCDLWYPGNIEALEYNEHLRNIVKTVPTTRAGVISDGDYTRSTKSADKRIKRTAMEASLVTGDQHLMGDEFSRASTYTQPRTVTLDTKFEGVPRIDVWTNYAILVISPTGERRVVVGPKTVLLNYEETLEVLSLSTGKPKNTDDMIRTVYLRVKHNNVSDVVLDIETADHVKVDVKLIHKVDFEGEPEKWFDIENYVKHLTDHVRSVVKGAAKQISIRDFYNDPIGFIRDTILGKRTEDGRAGMQFENGMRIKDVEILDVRIKDVTIQKMLDSAQHSVVTANIELTKAQHDLQTTREMETIRQTKDEILTETQLKVLMLQDTLESAQHVGATATLQRRREYSDIQDANELQKILNHIAVTMKEAENNNVIHEQKLKETRDHQLVQVEWLVEQTRAIVERAGAITPEMAVSIKQFAEAVQLKSLIDGFGELGVIHGKGLAKQAQEILDCLPQNLRIHSALGGEGNGKRLDE